MLVKQLADELGPQGTRVVGLMPGAIDTERVQYLNSLKDDPAGRTGEHRGLYPVTAVRHSRKSSVEWRPSCSPRPRPT